MKNKSQPFSGVITALVTPFKNGRIDYRSVKKLVRHQLDNGIQGLVVNGTTGESPTLKVDEVEELLKFVKKESDKAVPLILGTGTNSTEETIYKTKLAKKWKADAALVVVPYYNKPPQRALVAHFTQVAKQTKFPIILYNVPGRTMVSLTAESIARLAAIKNIIGLKEASGQMDIIKSLVPKVRPGFLLSSGEDGSCFDFILAGGQGVISVISNILPGAMRALSDRARTGNTDVLRDYKHYDQLNRLMNIESNPIPVKMMLYLMGIISSPELRLPLLALEGQYKSQVEAELKSLGII